MSLRRKRKCSRSLAALEPFFARGVPLVGLEPSCLFSFRDEALAMLPGEASKRAAAHALLFEEFIAREAKAGRFKPEPSSPRRRRCCCTAIATRRPSAPWARWKQALKLIPDLKLEKIESSCCGMAGAFGYQAETAEVSRERWANCRCCRRRASAGDAVLVADGTSCRHQIEQGAGKQAVHVASLLAAHLE